MMMKYELKKFFHKKINKIILIVMVFLASIISCLAVGSMRYRDAEGNFIPVLQRDVGLLLIEISGKVN